MQDLAGLPLVLMPADYCLRKMVEAECEEARVKTQVVLEMTSPEGILQAVTEGAGLTILPELYVRLRLAGSALRIIELYDPVPRHAVGLAYAVRRHQNRAAKEFGLLCRTTMEQLFVPRRVVSDVAWRRLVGTEASRARIAWPPGQKGRTLPCKLPSRPIE
jgi:LysR family transcriptional regulator, cyn operon transcriptional activator